jgi:hypothetical protein
MMLVKIQTHCKRLNEKMLPNLKDMLLLFSAANLDTRRHIESTEKIYDRTYDQNKSLKHKTERKNVQNSLNYGRKPSLSAILKTCEKNFVSFSKFQSFYINRKSDEK